MKIALINENSQAAKNALICDTLKKVVEPMGHTVYNYGMYSAEDANSLTYVQIFLLTPRRRILLLQVAEPAKALCLPATHSRACFAVTW